MGVEAWFVKDSEDGIGKKLAKDMKTSKPKRVLVTAHHWFHEVIGGSFRLATEFAEYLASIGHQVDYVCFQESHRSPEHLNIFCDPLAEAELHNNVRLFRLPFPQKQAGFNRVRSFRINTQLIVRSLHRINPYDSISAHSPIQSLGAFNAVAKERVFKNYTVHSPFDDELASHASNRKRLLNYIRVKFARQIEKKNLKLAQVVQTDSAYTLKSLQAKYPGIIGKRGVVAPGWVDLDSFRPSASRRELRAKLGNPWEPEQRTFLTVRRLEPRMGIDTLLHAVAKIRHEVPDFKVLIGGSGSQREALTVLSERLGIAPWIQFLGRIPESQLASTYAAADCFVLPTKALECFGLIVLEAFASGTPVIASRAAAIPEIAAQQGEDWMFDPGDTDTLATRMKSFVLGQLKPVVSLRDIAKSYDRNEVLKQWETLV